MSEPFIAEIRLFGFNFPPRGWATCDGQLLPISQNSALFALLGTNYGGNGTSNFGLPDLRGRVPMHPGQGPGLSQHGLGESGGAETVPLVAVEMPSHSHALMVSNEIGEDRKPDGELLARSTGGPLYGPVPSPPDSLVPLSISMVGPTGASQPHNNLMPFQVVNFCIALQGIFPPRPQ